MKYFGKHFHSSILVFVMFLLVGLACNLSNQVDSVSLTSTIANVVTEQEPLKVDTATPEPTQPQQLPTTTNQPTQIPSPTTPIMEITTPETTSQLEGVLWPQWASSAYASSEFDNPDWSASQIIGEPDTLECGDYSSAWASFDLTQEEYIEVMFGAYVFPLELHIYQSYFPNQVIRVQLIDYDFNYIDIYEGIPETVDACPFILTIPITIDPDIAVQGARITLDQSGLSGSQRNEIDAIELIDGSVMMILF